MTPYPVYILKQMSTGWGVIRFTFAKWEPDDTPSDSHFEKKCKPDEVSSSCHFILQMTTRWHLYLVYNFFENVNQMGVSSGYHLQNKMTTGWEQKLSFAIDSPPIAKLTTLINNITHKLLININNCLLRTCLKL